MNIWKLVPASPNRYWLFGAGMFVLATVSGDYPTIFLDPSYWSLLLFFLIPSNALIACWFVWTKINRNNENSSFLELLFPSIRFWFGLSIVLLIFLLIGISSILIRVFLLVYVMIIFSLFSNLSFLTQSKVRSVLLSLSNIVPFIIGLLFVETPNWWQLGIIGLSWSIGLGFFTSNRDRSLANFFLSTTFFSFSALLCLSLYPTPLSLASLLYPIMVFVTSRSSQEMYERSLNLLPTLNTFMVLLIFWLVRIIG